MSTVGDLIINNISSNPKDVKTHFTVVQVSKPMRGQTRYRCLRCQHEFECCGLGRLVQHITGTRPTPTKTRDVKACPNPYRPLRDSLLEVEEIRRKDLTAYRSLLMKRKDDGISFEDQYTDLNETKNFNNSSSNGPDGSRATEQYDNSGDVTGFSRDKLLALVLTMRTLSPQFMQLALFIQDMNEKFPTQSPGDITHLLPLLSMLGPVVSPQLPPAVTNPQPFLAPQYMLPVPSGSQDISFLLNQQVSNFAPPSSSSTPPFSHQPNNNQLLSFLLRSNSADNQSNY